MESLLDSNFLWHYTPIMNRVIAYNIKVKQLLAMLIIK